MSKNDISKGKDSSIGRGRGRIQPLDQHCSPWTGSEPLSKAVGRFLPGKVQCMCVCVCVCVCVCGGGWGGNDQTLGCGGSLSNQTLGSGVKSAVWKNIKVILYLY